jgi:hypothetical protein
MEVRVNVGQFVFNGDGGTPIRYEDIVLWRDVVFLVWDRPYSDEDRSIGAPAIGTFNYTGYIRRRDRIYFHMTYFSNVVADGHLPVIDDTKILLDGGVNTQPMTYDETSMKFWKTGEQYITAQSPGGQIENIDGREGERLTVELNGIIEDKMTHGTLDEKGYDRGLALYLKCKNAYIRFGTRAWHRRQQVLRVFEDEFLKYLRN